jgi:hypothetical protein
MPEEVCADVARELLRALLASAINDGDLVYAVRAAKAFRAVCVTFRDAFEDNKNGCEILARFTRGLIRQEKSRIVGVETLIQLHRMVTGGLPTQPVGEKAIAWIKELRKSLDHDMSNHKTYLAALGYKIDGCMFYDFEVMHRAMLPANHVQSLAKRGGGLPSGPWDVRASIGRLAPRGTCAWAESLLMRVRHEKLEKLAQVDRAAWAKRTAALILGTTPAQERGRVVQYVMSVADVLQQLSMSGVPLE